MGAIAPPPHFDPVVCQWEADLTPGPGGTVNPVVFVNFNNRAGTSLGAPQVASGLSYSAGTFTALVDGLWSVMLQVSGNSVANDAHWVIYDGGSWTGNSMRLNKLAADTGVYTAITVLGLKAGDTWVIQQSATGAQVPASDINLVVNRIG